MWGGFLAVSKMAQNIDSFHHIEVRNFSIVTTWIHRKGSQVKTYFHNHFHSGQGGGDVLGVWWSYCNRYTAGIQASVKGSNKIYTCNKYICEQCFKEYIFFYHMKWVPSFIMQLMSGKQPIFSSAEWVSYMSVCKVHFKHATRSEWHYNLFYTYHFEYFIIFDHFEYTSMWRMFLWSEGN